VTYERQYFDCCYIVITRFAVVERMTKLKKLSVFIWLFPSRWDRRTMSCPLRKHEYRDNRNTMRPIRVLKIHKLPETNRSVRDLNDAITAISDKRRNRIGLEASYCDRLIYHIYIRKRTRIRNSSGARRGG
jgi:hypothetical protein